MARYQIIDEPQTKSWGENVIVDPIIILFAAILVPLFWQPPMLGRFWIPALWIIVNGYLLGSATLGKECATIFVGALIWFAVLFGVSFSINNELIPLPRKDIYEYLFILQAGVFFLTMYLVIFQQASSYALYRYIRGGPE